MSYNFDDSPRFSNMRSSGGRGYRESGYRDSGYGDRRSGSRRNDSRDYRKRSGATAGTYHRGATNEKVPYIQGWKATRRGLVSIIASPAIDAKTKSPTQEKWVAKVSIGYENPFLANAFYNTATKKLTLPDLKLVLNPRAPRGGYCGSFFTRKNSR